MDILQDLNPSQREAVVYNDGPQLVIAGAGSGKTRVLTYKIAYLLAQGIPANRILALTFTNKAAREMKERIGKLVSIDNARYLWMGTFHSICGRILRQEADHLKYTRDFTIYDTQDSKSLIKQVLKQMQLDDKIYKPNVVLGRISQAKNMLILPDEYANNRSFAEQDRHERLYQMGQVYEAYQHRLKTANAMDFDDLLVNTCLYLKENQDARTYYQQIFQYILVDEYQDTNYVQYLLVRLLAEPENKVCVVGDDAQSIYSFRGADIRNILHFQKGYTNAKLFKLERNYRSTQTIVSAANSLIHHNQNQIFKEVYSEKEVGERIVVTPYMSDRDEGDAVARKIYQLHKSQGIDYEDIAILYRTNAQSRAFENVLRTLSVPYRIYGGTSFYQRKEVKDAIGYFRLAINPLDNEALLRVINFPARGIGATTLNRLSDAAAQHKTSMLDVARKPTEYALDVNKPTANRLSLFADMIDDFSRLAEERDAYEFADTVLQKSNLKATLALDRTAEGIDRAENIDELLGAIREFVEQRTEEGISFTPITDFLAEVSLLTDQDQNLTDQTSRVTLMTVHAAKGLEFKHVFIVGLEENLFPSQFSDSASSIEEERRLLYVAITRAMQSCHISYARQRFRNGSTNFTSPSRFLNDIDHRYLQVQETSDFFSTRPRWENNTWGDTPTKAVEPRRLSSLGSIPRVNTTAVEQEFASGDRVFHRSFGEGAVQRVYTENGNEKIDILFDDKGVKTLLLTYAKLERR